FHLFLFYSFITAGVIINTETKNWKNNQTKNIAKLAQLKPHHQTTGQKQRIGLTVQDIFSSG
ncbi:MAG: hypothetical protein ACOVP9_08525, partial [Flavobacterium stagni]